MLGLPIVIDAGVVIGNASFVLGVIELIGDIDQHGGIDADDLVAMTDARGNNQLPGPKRSEVERVAGAESGRIDTEVDERTVDVNVQRLRKILSERGYESYIQTVRGFGYRFAPPAMRE